MNITELKQQRLIIFEAIAGSRAYGLETPKSDTDIRGVFIMPKNDYYGLNYYSQISDSSNNVVYYELKRFFELLLKNNPNTLELLAMPDDCIQIQHLLFSLIKPEIFLSKLCKNTFAEYALSQIKKARGLHKKIVNPISKERKTILDFCYVIQDQGSMSLMQWLQKNNLKQQKCGLIKLQHMRDMYLLFYGDDFAGIMTKPTANEVKCSSVPKDMQPLAAMSFNKDGYKKYCKDYNEYWDWVSKRNNDRYASTISHGKNYDAKNVMHTFRLLEIAENIAKEGRIIVRPKNKDLYLNIRAGKFNYEDLVKKAQTRIECINNLFDTSDLPDIPDKEKIEKLLIQLRMEFYSIQSEIMGVSKSEL